MCVLYRDRVLVYSAARLNSSWPRTHAKITAPYMRFDFWSSRVISLVTNNHIARTFACVTLHDNHLNIILKQLQLVINLRGKQALYVPKGKTGYYRENGARWKLLRDRYSRHEYPRRACITRSHPALKM